MRRHHEAASAAVVLWVLAGIPAALAWTQAAIDRVSYEIHDLSKRAKDLASAAVLLSLVLCGGIWLAALWNRLA